MKNQAIKIPYALLDGKLVHISSIQDDRRGGECGCVCFGCNEAVVARKGESRVHHFAHSARGGNCTGESVLHKLGKRFLFERITDCLETGAELPVSFHCFLCGTSHTRNLLSKCVDVRMEFSVAEGRARADLMLLHSGGRPRVALEIVFSHAPEDRTVETYRDLNITKMEFHLAGDADLESLRSATPLVPANVDFCPTCWSAEKCPKCDHPLFPRVIKIAQRECMACKQTTKVVYGNWKNVVLGTDDLKPEERRYAELHGVKIKRNIVFRWQPKEYSSVCPHCDAPWGSQWLNEALIGEDRVESFSLLAECNMCGLVKSNWKLTRLPDPKSRRPSIAKPSCP